MHLKISKMCAASTDSVSSSMEVLDTVAVKNALELFDSLEVELITIKNATSNSSSIKPKDLLDCTATLDYNLDSLVSDGVTVIEKIKDLYNSIIAADDFEGESEKVDGLNIPLVPSQSIAMPGQNIWLDIKSKLTGNNAVLLEVVKGYEIVDVKVDNAENIIRLCLLIAGKKVWLDVKNGKLAKSNAALLNSVKGYDIKDIKTDSNGNIIKICLVIAGQNIWFDVKNGELTGNNAKLLNSVKGYDIKDIKTDSNGNIIKICLVIAGQNVWFDVENGELTGNNAKLLNSVKGYNIKDIKTDSNGNIIKICLVIAGQNIWFDVKNGELTGNNAKLLNSVKGYDIKDIKTDSNGNIIKICLVIAGQNVWFDVENGKISALNNLNIDKDYYVITDIIVIIGPDGNSITINPGKYKIIDIKMDATGNIIAICIDVNGQKVWLIIENNKIVGTMLQVDKSGVYIFNDVNLNIYDENGNIIGTITGGKYYFYEVILDENGNIIWIRISKDGEPVKWIKVYFSNNFWGEYLPFESETKYKNGILKLFNKDHGSLLGFLGILTLVTSAIIYAKKSKKKKKIKKGDFSIYEVSKNEKDEIIGVRISPDDYLEDEYWINFDGENDE